jgi:hypothetical protein
MDNRKAFIRKAKQIVGSRPVIFKLHPLEKETRARREIQSLIPRALVLADGNTEHMVANCDVLVTQTSSVTFTGLAMGKEVHTDLDLPTVKKLLPIQNGGLSGQKIANVCRYLAQVPHEDLKVGNRGIPLKRDWLGSDVMG